MHQTAVLRKRGIPVQPFSMDASPVTAISWRALARCRGVDPEIFHPAPEDEGEAAKAICGLCPVREPCLDEALLHREKDGVWGGLTARERRRLLRQRRKSA